MYFLNVAPNPDNAAMDNSIKQIFVNDMLMCNPLYMV